jgi:integrase
VRLPPIRRRRVPVFWPDELQLLLIHAKQRHPTNSCLVILLLSRTGLRIGEALTLQVQDLDLENRDLWVQRTWGTRHQNQGNARRQIAISV